MSRRILLVEDNRDLAETLYLALEDEGYELDYAMDGQIALNLLDTEEFDAVVLDINLPLVNGYHVCATLRKNNNMTPVLMLTARDTLEDKLMGFAEGADDYLIKPFATEELVARLAALLRRGSADRGSPILQLGDLQVDRQRRVVTREDQLIELSPTEFQILDILASAAPGVVKRGQLETSLWGDDVGDSDSLRSHIYTLRQAIDKPFDNPIIVTLRGVGWRLAASPTPAQQNT